MRTNKIAYLLLAALVGTTLLAFVPTAEAQTSAQVVVSITPNTERVKPLQGPIAFSGTAQFTADYSAGANIIGIPVTYTVSQKPAWATVLVSPATDIFPGPSATGAATPGAYTTSRTFTITVTASDQAPAFTAEQIEITATTTPTQGGKAAIGKAQVPIVADFYSILDLQLAKAITLERPQTPVDFPVKITNFGNANTKVTFEVTQITEGFDYTLPIPVTLQSKQAGGSQISADVLLTVQTPYKNGYMNEVGTANYKVTSAYALDPKLRGDESVVSVLITTRGFYVPSVSPLLFVAMLGALALVIRRRD